MKKNFKDGDIVIVCLNSENNKTPKKEELIEEARFVIERDTVFIVHDNADWNGDKPDSLLKRRGFRFGWLVGYILDGEVNFHKKWIKSIKLSNNNKFKEK